MNVFFCLFQVNVHLHTALIFFPDGIEKNEFAITRAAYHQPGALLISLVKRPVQYRNYNWSFLLVELCSPPSTVMIFARSRLVN